MDEKISLDAIARYADAYAENIMRSFFSAKDQITGKEILSLSSVYQVNLFVIREVFKAWKEETRKNKSVYFDYEHSEVKEALSNYMSVVSNHILIDQQNLAPLLKKAVSQTLLVIFDPYDFFSLLISGTNNKLEVVSFKEEIKYLKVNKAPLERMLSKLEEKGILEIAGNEAFAILDQILEEVNFTPEDLDEYIEMFSDVIPLNPESFYVPKQTEKNTYREATNTPKNRTEPPAQKANLNEQLNSSQRPAVMDNLSKITRIKEHLSINQKFMFTKVLFYGDFDSFSRAIDEIDQLPDMKAAVRYLERHSLNWDQESKEFHEFMELVEKRFS